MAEQLLTVEEVAEILKMSPDWVRKRIQHREISYVKLGGSVRVPLSEVDLVIESSTVTKKKS